MVVTEPLKVTITNFPSEHFMELVIPNFPADESRGSHKIKFDSVIYIEKSDFTEVEQVYFDIIHKINMSIEYLIVALDNFRY